MTETKDKVVLPAAPQLYKEWPLNHDMTFTLPTGTYTSGPPKCLNLLIQRRSFETSWIA